MKANTSALTGQSLLEILREEAQDRGLIPASAGLSADEVFSLVRDMPYLRATSRQPGAVLREWRGTCSGKHYLLNQLFQELGYETRIIMCTHQFTQENSRHFPESLRVHLAGGPIPDVHTFLRLRPMGSDSTELKADAGWTRLDATWPRETAVLGMTVNQRFEPGMDMQLACQPIEFFEVPEEADPQAFKEQLIGTFCAGQMSERELLIEGIGEWLTSSGPRSQCCQS